MKLLPKPKPLLKLLGSILVISYFIIMIGDLTFIKHIRFIGSIRDSSLGALSITLFSGLIIIFAYPAYTAIMAIFKKK